MISIDEKSSIQALERTAGDVENDNGKTMRGFKSTYTRHGTLNLFAALRVVTGRITSHITMTRRREDFLGFMDAIIAETPADKELHGILTTTDPGGDDADGSRGFQYPSDGQNRRTVAEYDQWRDGKASDDRAGLRYCLSGLQARGVRFQRRKSPKPG